MSYFCWGVNSHVGVQMTGPIDVCGCYHWQNLVTYQSGGESRQVLQWDHGNAQEMTYIFPPVIVFQTTMSASSPVQQ